MIAQGANDPRKRPGYHQNRKLHTDSLNVIILSHQRLNKLEEALEKINLDIVGLSERRLNKKSEFF